MWNFYTYIFISHHLFCCAVWPLGSGTWLCAISFINQSRIHGFHFWNYSDSLKHIWGKCPGPGTTNICLRNCTYAYFEAITYVVCKYMFFGKHKGHLRSTYAKNKIHFNPFSFYDCPMSVADTNAPRLFQPIRDNLRAETEVPTAVVAMPRKQG